MSFKVKVIAPILFLLLSGCNVSLKDYYPYNQQIGKRYTFIKDSNIVFIDSGDIGHFSVYTLNEMSNRVEHISGELFKAGNIYSIKPILFKTEFVIEDVIIPYYCNPYLFNGLQLICNIEGGNEDFKTFSISYIYTDYKVEEFGTLGTPPKEWFMEVKDE